MPHGHADRPARPASSIAPEDRKTLPHILAAYERLENLWAAGTDYCQATVDEARKTNRMLHLDLDMTGECKLKCFYCDRTPDRYSDVPNRVELTTDNDEGRPRRLAALGLGCLGRRPGRA